MRPDDPVLRKCREVLRDLYGERLKGVMLFGSCARGTETEESDVDILVLLEGPVDVAEEILRVHHAFYGVQLEMDRHVSFAPADVESYRSGALNFYRVIKDDGVPV